MTASGSRLSPTAQNELETANQLFMRLLPPGEASPEYLAGLQAEKLGALLDFICRYVPHYRRLKRSAEPLRMLPDLPVVDKAVLMNGLPDTCAEPEVTFETLRAHVNQRSSPYDLFRDQYHIRRTSGTTGFVGYFLWDLALAKTAEASATRFVPHPRALPKPVVAVSPITYWDPILAILEDLHSVPLGAGVEGSIEYLHRLKPKSIIGSTGFVAALAQEQIDGRLRVSPEMIVIGAEQCTQWQWNLIRTAWNREPHMQYGLSEAGLIASRCSEGFWHIHEDTVILECLDSRWRPADPGQPCAHALLTRLFGPIQPIVRYELSDLLIAGPEKCRCGGPFRTLASIGGRKRAVLWLEGEHGECLPISAYHLIPELESTAGLMRYQLRYAAPNELEISILTRRELDRAGLIERIAGVIRAAGAKPPGIVLQTGEIPTIWAAPPDSKEHHVDIRVSREAMLQFIRRSAAAGASRG